MKKIYINPDIKVVMINTSLHVLTGSNDSMGYKGDYDSETVTIGSRRDRKTVWDDEEEDEEDFY